MNEELIAHLAEIKALQTVNTYLLQVLLESVGCEGEALQATIDNFNSSLADRYEREMRTANGLPSRDRRRGFILPRISEMEHEQAAPWNKMRSGGGGEKAKSSSSS